MTFLDFGSFHGSGLPAGKEGEKRRGVIDCWLGRSPAETNINQGKGREEGDGIVVPLRRTQATRRGREKPLCQHWTFPSLAETHLSNVERKMATVRYLGQRVGGRGGKGEGGCCNYLRSTAPFFLLKAARFTFSDSKECRKEILFSDVYFKSAESNGFKRFIHGPFCLMAQ